MLTRIGGAVCALAFSANTFAGDFDYFNCIGAPAAQAPQIAVDQTNRFSQQIANVFSGPMNATTVWTPSQNRKGGATGAGASYNRQLEVFGSFYGGVSGQDKLGERYTHYRTDAFALTLGGGWRLGEEFFVGLVGNYTYSNTEYGKEHYGVDNYEFRQYSRDNMLRIGAVGDFGWDKIHLVSTPTFGVHFTEGKVNADIFKRKEDYAAIDLSWHNQLSYEYEISENWQITPTYALGATWLRNPEYRQTGGDGDLKFNAYNHFSLSQSLLLKVGCSFDMGQSVKLTGDIYGGWEYEYLNNKAREVSYDGREYNGYGDAPKNRALLGAGLRMSIGDSFDIYGSYDQRLWDGGFMSTFAIGAGVKF